MIFTRNTSTIDGHDITLCKFQTNAAKNNRYLGKVIKFIIKVYHLRCFHALKCQNWPNEAFCKG